jgi:ABC-type Fe3+ transport system permease subunit
MTHYSRLRSSQLDHCAAFARIEFLVVFTVLLLIARFALPIFLPRAFSAFDHTLRNVLGLPDVTGFVVSCALIFGVIVFGLIRAWQYWRRRFTEKSRFSTLVSAPPRKKA